MEPRAIPKRGDNHQDMDSHKYIMYTKNKALQFKQIYK